MQEISDANLDLAYKYPFSAEAREYITKLGGGFDPSMLEKGKLRLDEAFQKSRIEYSKTSIKAVKQAYIVSYIYARMLVSAIGSKLAIDKYVRAEARRCGEALKDDTEDNITRIAKELGTRLEYEKGFHMPLPDFLMLSPKTPEFALVHQELDKGVVYLQKYRAAKIVEAAISKEIMKGLPISAKTLPKEIMAYSKGIKVPVLKVNVKIDENKYEWIAKLLTTPIPDVRHRTVNLILAPYLVNIKGMSEDDAAKVIIDYIERCKQIEPNTKVNETYIRYQCKYAKAKGSKPLTYDNAKDLLKSVIAF